MPSVSELLQSTTNRLVAANVLIFVIILALFKGQRTGLELVFWHNPEFRIWQLFSYMFLHADWAHLAFNMIALWSFGRVLERVWGGQRLLFFYVVCGIGAALLHLAVAYYQFNSIHQQILSAGFSERDFENVIYQGHDISVGSAELSKDTLLKLYTLFNAPAVGASGAVFGVMLAFALLFPNFKIFLIFLPIPIAAKFFVPVLLAIELSAGITGFSIFGRNIAHFAHLGGALTGFILVQYWLRQHPKS